MSVLDQEDIPAYPLERCTSSRMCGLRPPARATGPGAKDSARAVLRSRCPSIAGLCAAPALATHSYHGTAGPPARQRRWSPAAPRCRATSVVRASSPGPQTPTYSLHRRRSLAAPNVLLLLPARRWDDAVHAQVFDHLSVVI